MRLPKAIKGLAPGYVPVPPKAPIVMLHWFDACFDSEEKVRDEPAKDYRVGCPDVLVGFYLGIRKGCLVIAESAYVHQDQRTIYRHIWNIPQSLVIKIQELTTRR